MNKNKGLYIYKPDSASQGTGIKVAKHLADFPDYDTKASIIQ